MSNHDSINQLKPENGCGLFCMAKPTRSKIFTIGIIILENKDVQLLYLAEMEKFGPGKISLPYYPNP